MIKNSHAAIVFFFLATIALLTLVGWSFYRIGVGHRQAREYARVAEERAVEDRAFQSLRAIQVSAQGDLAAFDNAVFSETKIVSLIETLEMAGRTLGASVEIVSVDASVPGTRPEGVRLVVDVTGSWMSASIFLQALESLPYRVVFEGVSLTKLEGLWKTHFTLFIPIFK